MLDPRAHLAELLATELYPAALARPSLGLAGAAKRRAGLTPELVEAVLALIDWPVVAQNNADALPKQLPASHLLLDLLPRTSHALAEATLFDVPLETFTGLVGALGLQGSQVEDAFRYVELGDPAAFERLVPALQWRSTGVPSLDAKDAIVTRACHLLWRSRESTTPASAPARIAAVLSQPRRAGRGLARALSLELGLPSSAHGQPDRRYPDPGPLLSVAQQVDPELLATYLQSELARVHLAAEALDRVATLAWDARADAVRGDELVIERATHGLRFAGTAALKKLAANKGRWALGPGRVTAASTDLDPRGLKALLEASAKLHLAVPARLAADSPDIGAVLTAKTLLLAGPDVARVLAPVASAKALRGALDGLLQRTPSVETAEAAQTLIDHLDEAPPKLLTAAAERGHVAVVAALLAKFPPAAKAREAARLAAESAHAYACATLLAQ